MYTLTSQLAITRVKIKITDVECIVCVNGSDTVNFNIIQFMVRK